MAAHDLHGNRQCARDGTKYPRGYFTGTWYQSKKTMWAAKHDTMSAGDAREVSGQRCANGPPWQSDMPVVVLPNGDLFQGKITARGFSGTGIYYNNTGNYVGSWHHGR